MSYTNAQVVALIAKLEAKVDALAQAPAPAISAPATPKAESQFVRDVIRGRHACAAKPACSRTLRTAARAKVHDDGTLGHIAR